MKHNNEKQHWNKEMTHSSEKQQSYSNENNNETKKGKPIIVQKSYNKCWTMKPMKHTNETRKRNTTMKHNTETQQWKTRNVQQWNTTMKNNIETQKWHAAMKNNRTTMKHKNVKTTIVQQ